MALPEIIQRVYVTNESVQIISHEKMYASIPAGTLWVPLIGTAPNSAILYGDLEYAADMIHETKNGARGRSFKDTVSGYKIYLEGINLETFSSNINYDALNIHNYSSEEEFLQDTQTYLDSYGKTDLSNGDEKVDQQGGGKLLWKTDENKKNLLFVSKDSIGLVMGKQVHILGSDGLVMVDDGAVVIQGRGKNLIIDQNGIRGPPELRDIGKTISKAVKDAMKNIDLKLKR